MGDKRILCCGLVCADFFNICNHYPIEDSDEHIVKQYWQRGGNASNTSTVLALLGSLVEFFGGIPARSNHRYFFESDMKQRSINFENCVYYNSDDCPQATIIYNLETGSRTILYTNHRLPELKFEDFQKFDLSQYSWIHFEGRPNVDEIIKMLNSIDDYNRGQESATKITTSVELEKKRSNLDLLLDKADVVFVGREFALSRNFTNPDQACLELLKRTRPGSIVIVAWSDQGARAALNDSDKTLLCAAARPPNKIMDSTGAGDTFNAAVIHSLNNEQNSLLSAVNFGCEIAGRKIGNYGFDHITK